MRAVGLRGAGTGAAPQDLPCLVGKAENEAGAGVGGALAQDSINGS